MTSGGLLVWGEPYRHAAIIDTMARQFLAFTSTWPPDHCFMERFQNQDLTQEWIANLFPGLEHLVASHIAFFERLFDHPAREQRCDRWGLKDIGLNTGHAQYLKWLFPQARFLFLLRNPYETWASYRSLGPWYWTWPDRLIRTPRQFGCMWKELTDDFLANCHRVDGLLIRYEELSEPATRRRIETHLGVRLKDPADLERISHAPAASRRIPSTERRRLRRAVEPTASRLGYTG